MMLSGMPSRASSSACSWRSWCGAKRRRTPARAASRRSSERTAATGTITAIDRSPKMVEMATRRNREHVDAGRAVLEAVALEDADLGDRGFDKVFAFNVAPFWQQPEAALGAVREHLARDGAVYLFWDARHSAPERARDLGNELADRLREGGFSVDRVLVEDLRPVPAVCAIGRRQGR